MAKEVIELDANTQAEINALTNLLESAKSGLKEKQTEVHNIECKIFELVSSKLKDKGTNNFINGLKIVTGYTDKWEQDKLEYLRNNDKLAIWPFKTEYKPDAKAIATIKEHFPEDWKKVEDCLTLTPKKPSFTVTGEE